MHALHGRDDAELSEPVDVVGMYVLRVLDAPPLRGHAVVLGERALVDIQDHAVRPVSDGMRVHLKPQLGSDAGGLLDVVGRLDGESDTAGHVLIGLQEPRTV